MRRRLLCEGRKGARPPNPRAAQGDVREMQAPSGRSAAGRVRRPASGVPARCAALTAENKETVNSPEMSLEEEGADQVAKVFFNAKGLIILGLSE